MALSNETRAVLEFEARKKSVIISYLLWFFFGQLGGHRFYHGKIITGIIQLTLAVFGWLFVILIVGWILLVPLWIWLLVDAFLIPLLTTYQNLIIRPEQAPCLAFARGLASRHARPGPGVSPGTEVETGEKGALAS